MERVITCPICESTDHCFEEMQEDYSSYMCFNCGFMSDTRFTDDAEETVQGDSSLLINELKTFDKERKIWWCPSVVNMGALGLIFPEGSINNWSWKYATVKKISSKEKKDLGDQYESILDVKSAKTYQKYDFLSACKAMGIVKDI